MKRPWCWEGLGAGEEGDNRGWDGWMASLTQWTLVWVYSGVGDGQGGLACCDSWDHKESDMTERLNWTELMNPFRTRHNSSEPKEMLQCIVLSYTPVHQSSSPAFWKQNNCSSTPLPQTRTKKLVSAGWCDSGVFVPTELNRTRS